MDLAANISTQPEGTSTREDAAWSGMLDAALEACFAHLKEKIAEVPPDPPPVPPPTPVQRPVSTLGRGGLSSQRWIAHPSVQRLSSAFENRSWIAVFASLIAVYIVINFVLPGMFSASLNTYLVQPLIWLYLAVNAVLCWKYGLSGRPAASKPLIRMAAFAGTFQVTIAVIAGFLSGFGPSPHSHRPLALVGHLAHVGMMTLGIETSRACLVVVLGRRRRGLGIAVSSLLFALLSIPAAEVGPLFDGPHSAIQFLGQVLFPALSQSVLASYLALTSGPVASATYSAILRAFAYLSPVLPDLHWIASAAVGTLAPMAGLRTILRQLGLTGQKYDF